MDIFIFIYIYLTLKLGQKYNIILLNLIFQIKI